MLTKTLLLLSFMLLATAQAESNGARPMLTEDEFLRKWGQYVHLVVPSESRRLQGPPGPGGNPFSLLMQVIQQITSAWQSIVNAFKSSYKEQLLESHLNNGWSKYKQATKVFKGAGLPYDKMDSFFADIKSMVAIPANYSSDFDKQIHWIKFFDNTTWSEHNTQFSSGKGGSDNIFTMYARNRDADQKVDVLFLTCTQSFKLADDYFVISESKSILGGLFSSTKIKFKKKPAALSTADLMFVSEYFSLLAYQQIALAEGMAAPPDPQFPPGMPAVASA